MRDWTRERRCNCSGVAVGAGGREGAGVGADLGDGGVGSAVGVAAIEVEGSEGGVGGERGTEGGRRAEVEAWGDQPRLASRRASSSSRRVKSSML